MPSIDTDRLFAYSISAMDDCWSWRVYDVDGQIVAFGQTSSKLDAHEAIARVYEPERGSAAGFSASHAA